MILLFLIFGAGFGVVIGTIAGFALGLTPLLFNLAVGFVRAIFRLLTWPFRNRTPGPKAIAYSI